MFIDYVLGEQGKTIEQALDSFTQATHSVLAQEGKTPVVWEGKLILFTDGLKTDQIPDC